MVTVGNGQILGWVGGECEGPFRVHEWQNCVLFSIIYTVNENGTNVKGSLIMIYK